MTETIAQRTQFFTVAGFAGIVGLVIVTLAAVITGWQVYLGAQQVVQAAKADTDNAAGKTADLLQRSKLEFNAALEVLQKRTATPEQVQALQSQLDQTRQFVT